MARLLCVHCCGVRKVERGYWMVRSPFDGPLMLSDTSTCSDFLERDPFNHNATEMHAFFRWKPTSETNASLRKWIISGECTEIPYECLIHYEWFVERRFSFSRNAWKLSLLIRFILRGSKLSHSLNIFLSRHRHQHRLDVWMIIYFWCNSKWTANKSNHWIWISMGVDDEKNVSQFSINIWMELSWKISF